MKVECVLRWPSEVLAPALLNALDEAGYHVRRTRGRERTEIRWDTQDGALRAARAALVFHVEESRWSLVTPRRSLAEAGGAAPPDGGRLAAELVAATRGRALLPLLTGKVDEEIFRATRTGVPAVQLALRQWAFTSPLRPGARAARAFVHAIGTAAAAERTAVTLQERTRCRRVGGSVLELGLAALRLTTPGRQPPPRTWIRATDTVAQALARLLARQGWTIAANAPGTAADLDPEFLHDLRVAARRARGVLRLARLAGLTPDAGLAAELAWLAQACGPLRDLDVFLAGVGATLVEAETPPEAREAILLTLRGQRDAALGRARAAFVSPRLKGLLTMLRQPPSPGPEDGPGAVRVANAAAALASGEIKRLVRWRRHEAAGLTDGDLHRVRIGAKRARYVLEFFAPLLPPEARKVVRVLVRLQDTLGAHHDAAVAVQRLDALATAMHASGANLETILALGALRHAAVERKSARRAEFAARSPRLWRRLRAFASRLSAPSESHGSTS
jgi:CHAD domain-containing protein